MRKEEKYLFRYYTYVPVLTYYQSLHKTLFFDVLPDGKINNKIIVNLSRSKGGIIASSYRDQQ